MGVQAKTWGGENLARLGAKDRRVGLAQEALQSERVKRASGGKGCGNRAETPAREDAGDAMGESGDGGFRLSRVGGEGGGGLPAPKGDGAKAPSGPIESSGIGDGEAAESGGAKMVDLGPSPSKADV